jgi:hypothetical protein
MRNAKVRLVSLRVFIVLSLGLMPAVLGWSSSAAQSSSAAASKSPELPGIDQILARYVQAEGGRAAWQKLTSRVSKGAIEVPSMGLSGTVEIHEKAPNRLLGIITIGDNSFRQGFDGKVGWTNDPQNGLREQTGEELAETSRDADFYHPLDLRKLYTNLTVQGEEKIGERAAYLVEATPPEGGDPDKIYFDTQTALPIRVVSQHHGADGASELVEDFEDFRDVDGVKLPFTLRQTTGGTTLTITLSEIHHNVPIEDAEFTKPAAQ